jgi:tRNA(adenine34) deaminase
VVRILQGAPFLSYEPKETSIAPHFDYSHDYRRGSLVMAGQKLSEIFCNSLMREALAEAQKAEHAGEVPIGAVVYHQGSIIARAHNLIETERDASRHAEMVALQAASRVVDNWRLNEMILCVTLEPCSMCAGMIRLSRVGTVIFGAYDPRLGAVGSLFNLAEDPRLGALPRVISSVMEKECGEILSGFFEKARLRS